MAKHNDKLETRSTKAKSSKKIRKFPHSRKLKVRESVYFYQYDQCFRSRNPCCPPVPVPWINIKGYWLNKVGFTIGTPLKVRVSKGRIFLSIIPVSSRE